MTTFLQQAVWTLADTATDPDIDPTTGHGPEWGKAAPVALLIILLMAVALFFLIKSMNKQLRRVPKTFDPSAEAAAPVEGDLADDELTNDELAEPGHHLDDALNHDLEDGVHSGADEVGRRDPGLRGGH